MPKRMDYPLVERKRGPASVDDAQIGRLNGWRRMARRSMSSRWEVASTSENNERGRRSWRFEESLEMALTNLDNSSKHCKKAE